MAASSLMLTVGTLFNVRDYGAFGDGIHDDTPAIRATLAAVKASGQPATVQLAGTHAVCPQSGDVIGSGFSRAIFDIAGMSNVTIHGGTLKGYYDGLTDPKTHWLNTGDSYSKISRFTMFRGMGAVSNFQFRNLTIDGQAGWTGDYTVGGNVTTGDGWDMGHKCFQFDGSQPIDGIVIADCNLRNWRGEIIYAGGGVGRIGIFNTTVASTNASAISCSADTMIDGCTIGGTNLGDDVYNGIENFCRTPTQKTVVGNSRISCGSATRHGNGLVFLGTDGTSLTVKNTTIQNSHFGILFSEAARNVVIGGNIFSNNDGSMIDSILGLYKDSAGRPLFQTGFSDFLIYDNLFVNSGWGYGSQGRSPGYSFPNLKIRDNYISAGSIIQGAFSGRFDGFELSNNTFGLGGKLFNLS